MTIGEVIAKRRTEMERSGIWVAEKVGIGISLYYAYEKDKFVPNAYTFMDICKVLGLELQDFA